MAQTPFASPSNVLIRSELWARRTFLWAQDKMYFKPFMASQDNINDTRTAGDNKGVSMQDSTNALIMMSNARDFTNGATIDMYIMAPLLGDGKVDNEKLLDNEEALTFYDQSLTVHKRRHAVSKDDYTQFTSVFSGKQFDSMARMALGNWLAQKADTDILLALSGLANSAGTLSANVAPASRRIIGGQTTGGVYTIESNDAGLTDNTSLFGTKVIDAAKRKAQTGGTGYPKIRPLEIGGKSYYVMFVHPLAMKALRQEAAWVAAQSDANIRGSDNPLWTGAEGVWNGVIIHEWDKIESRVGDGTGTDPSTYFESGDAAPSGDTIVRNLLCGQQAGLFAIGRNMKWQEELTDYGNTKGVAIEAIFQAAKTEFNSVDYGVIAVDNYVELDS